MKVLEGPLNSVSRVARPYPAYHLHSGMTGLVLFAAAYLGHNDAIHFARQEMRATCVDVDQPLLEEMVAFYPADWSFTVADAWEFAAAAADRGETWDVVSVDTFTGDATDRSLTTLELWCSLASEFVTATIRNGQPWEAPAGWDGYLFERSSDVSWLVLER